jgi:putative ATPase
MTILAGEDVGLADPQAMGVVVSCWEAFERIGMPEGRFHLAQAALYLATCPKSNSALGFFDALAAVEKEQETDVPNHLKDGNRDSEGFGHGKGYLYPHAYQDHWVAQQYLPDALQGKIFYEPSDQGYEHAIRDDVARQREAQLAAMVEPGDWRLEMGEIYTTSPENRARDAWLQRTISQSGQNLSQQRDKLFTLAQVQRHHLVLDVNAGSGLLTWEAMRRAPEGGVWALTADVQAGEALRQLAAKLPEVERPFVLIGGLAELDYLLELRGERDVRFDRIVGRNVLTGGDLRLTIEGLAGRLAENGRLCLIQTIPRHGQRLYDLVDWSNHEALREKVVAAEETIYHDETDPLVNWEEGDVETALTAVQLTNIQIHIQNFSQQRQITQDHLKRWFGEGGNGRLSYKQRLQAAVLSTKEIAVVEKLYSHQLQNQLIPWHTHVSYILAQP